MLRIVQLVQYIYWGICSVGPLINPVWTMAYFLPTTTLISVVSAPLLEGSENKHIFLSIMCEHKATFNRLNSSVWREACSNPVLVRSAALSFNVFKPFINYLSVSKRKKTVVFFVLSFHVWGISSLSWSNIRCRRNTALSEKNKKGENEKSRTRRRWPHKGAPVCAWRSVRSVCLYAICMQARCVFEWRIKGPHAQGLHGADSWPIKRGPPKAEWKNEIEKKKETPTSEEAPAVRISKVQRCNCAGWKRAYLSLKHASNPQPTMSAYKRWGWKQRDQRGCGGWVGEWMEGRMEGWSDRGNRPVSFTFLFPAFHAWAVCILSATGYSLAFEVKARVGLLMQTVTWQQHMQPFFKNPASCKLRAWNVSVKSKQSRSISSDSKIQKICWK